jgi:ATP-dependent RNA helicase RhlE
LSKELTTITNFNELGLSEPILRAISDAGYTTPTPIQAKAIPQVLSGGDLLAGAQTGTGKTAGFTLPILQLLSTKPIDPSKGRPRCLMLTPTRELAAQIEESVKTYGKHLPLKSMVVFGGVSINPQINRLSRHLDILVATPGRLLDLAEQKAVDLSGVEILVLDEADRMLDMGFIRDIKKILAMLPKQRQNLLFSATFSDEIKTLADGLLYNPGFVEVARRNTASEMVEQTVHMVNQSHKRELMSYLIKHHEWKQVLIFTRTKHGANRLTEKLVKDGIEAAAIHGNKSQGARTKALAQFKDGSMRVLVATDIAARGLDIDQLPQVVNFELPNVPEDYVHRIGRTGRAGASGAAISLVDNEETKYLKDIEKLIKREIPRVSVEGFVMPTTIELEAPRPPRQPHGRQPRNSQRASNGQQPNSRDGQRQGEQRNSQGKSRNVQGQSMQGQRPQVQANKEHGNRTHANSNKPEQNKQLSEAARHQSMPQTGLFSPPQPTRHHGRPSNRPANKPTTRPNNRSR